jgi:hypothetical protein
MNITPDLVKTLPNFGTIKQVEAHNENAGHYFFSPGTRRFFRSRVHSNVYGGCVFVTSEKCAGFRGRNYPRAFTVRMIHENGSIDTVGEFQAFTTRHSAHFYARLIGEEINELR